MHILILDPFELITENCLENLNDKLLIKKILFLKFYFLNFTKSINPLKCSTNFK